MLEWLDSLSTTENFLLYTGIFSTLIFLLQFFLSLAGIADDDSDSEGGTEEGYSLGDVFTLRNGVSFLMGFSWGGLMVYDWGITHPFFIALLGSMAGSFLVVLNMLLLFSLSKLKHEGNIHLENAIDGEATVTLTVPERRTGVGKVMVTVQGRLKEIHAVTDGDALEKNSNVVVLDLSGGQLIVGKLEA